MREIGGRSIIGVVLAAPHDVVNWRGRRPRGVKVHFLRILYAANARAGYLEARSLEVLQPHVDCVLGLLKSGVVFDVGNLHR